MNFEEALLHLERELGEPPENPLREADGWSFGERVTVIEDDDDHGLCAGDEGMLVIESIGGRTVHSILMDGNDTTLQVDPDNIDGA